jgi:hypothetical protein
MPNDKKLKIGRRHWLGHRTHIPARAQWRWWRHLQERDEQLLQRLFVRPDAEAQARAADGDLRGPRYS